MVDYNSSFIESYIFIDIYVCVNTISKPMFPFPIDGAKMWILKPTQSIW